MRRLRLAYLFAASVLVSACAMDDQGDEDLGDPHAGAAATGSAPEPTTPPAKKPAGTPGNKKRDYIEVDRPSPTPKELGDSSKAKLAMEKEAKKEAKETQTQRQLAEERLDARKGKASTPPADPAPAPAPPAAGRTAPAATSSGAAGPSSGAGAGGAGGGAGSAHPGLSVGGATAPAPNTTNNRQENTSKDARRQPASPAPQAPAASPPPPPPSSDATIARDRAGEKNDTKADIPPAEDITWARAEHERVIASVKANKCMDAANRALVIESRTPAYYAQNVANDRAIKSCVSYITAERSRRIEAEKRASRAKATERRADEPAKPTTTNK